MPAVLQSKKLDKMEESLVKYVSNVYGSQGVSETEKVCRRRTLGSANMRTHSVMRTHDAHMRLW